MNWKMKTCAIVAASLFSGLAWADVELPQEELARESVTPKFENTVSVKNRNINLDGKVEVGVYYGMNFSEAIENQSKVGLNLGYHFSEEQAVVLNWAQWMSGLNSQYAGPLQSVTGLNMSRTPTLQSSGWLNWEPTLFYGKISVTKQGVGNLSFYPILGLGETTYSNKMYYGINAGAGFHFYFNKTWALSTDMKLQYCGKPNPFLSSNLSSQPAPSQSSFADEYVISTIFDIGVVALF